MDRGINPHRNLVGVLASDLFVNFEQIAVTFPNGFLAKTLDRVGKIEINNISVATGRKHNRVACDVVDLTSPQISGDDSLGVSIDDHDVEHFGLGKHLDCAGSDLAAER